jgi:hypothetical protein
MNVIHFVQLRNFQSTKVTGMSTKVKTEGGGVMMTVLGHLVWDDIEGP